MLIWLVMRDLSRLGSNAIQEDQGDNFYVSYESEILRSVEARMEVLRVWDAWEMIPLSSC